MDPNVDYAGIYRDISSKLQKKIFRQVNFEEAKHDFALMAKSLAAEDTYDHAAVFSLGKAKCAALASNRPVEAVSLMESGRLFVKAEECLQITSAFSLGELLGHAICCFLKASKIYESCTSLTHAANCYIFAGDILTRFDNNSEALNVYSLAGDIFCRDAPRVLQILMKCLRSCISTRDFSSALSNVIKMQDLMVDACHTHGYEVEVFEDQMKACELYRILLVLVTSSPKSWDDAKGGATSLLSYMDESEKFSEDSFAHFFSSDLLIKLRSLIMAWASKDLDTLELTTSYLQPDLDHDQQTILHYILELFTFPPGDIP